jgi:hypothetical protein
MSPSRTSSAAAARPKSGEPRVSAAVDHDVGRLEIAMQDAAVVRGRKARAHLPRDFDAFVGRQAADSPQQRREVLAVDELHGQEVTPIHVADVIHAAHVGMRDLARDPNLVEEPFEARRLAADFFRQELERNGLTELQILRPVDFSHAAASD